MFVQIGCTLPAEDITSRQINGLLYACICVFVALAMINYLDFIKKVQENSYLEWDLKTVTSGDYTIEFELPAGFFDNWVKTKFLDWVEDEHRLNQKNYLAKVEAFRDWITFEME